MNSDIGHPTQRDIAKLLAAFRSRARKGEARLDLAAYERAYEDLVLQSEAIIRRWIEAGRAPKGYEKLLADLDEAVDEGFSYLRVAELKAP